VVDVVHEAVERIDTLAQAGLELLPLALGDDARMTSNGIKRSVPAPSSSLVP
jgi:hypothetical protein